MHGWTTGHHDTRDDVCANRGTYADPYRSTGPGIHADAHSDADRHSYPNAHAGCHSHPNRDALSDRDIAPSAYAHIDTQGHGYHNRDALPHSEAELPIRAVRHAAAA